MTGLPSDLARSFQVSGFALLDDLVSNGELPALQREADLVLSEAHDSGGARNVFAKSRLFRELAASSSLADLATLADEADSVRQDRKRQLEGSLASRSDHRSPGTA
jgi:hypothetical protein